MELSDLEELFDQARKLTNHSEFVVVGSLSILGVVPGRNVPARMLMSIDVDCFTRRDPGRIFDLSRDLGEGSPFEASHGFYLDPISPNVPSLPENWQHRLVRIPLAGGLVLFFSTPTTPQYRNMLVASRGTGSGFWPGFRRDCSRSP